MEKTDISQEQSMEEILQSIKRIIADDESAEAEEAAAATVKKAASSAQDDDILELSDFVDEPNVNEHDSLADLLSGAPVSNAKPADDILASIDGLLNADVAQASTSALQQLRKLNQTQSELQQPHVVGAVSFRSGVTMEDIVVEMLKPELKTWLNNNLPQIVERLVQAEIKKIAAN